MTSQHERPLINVIIPAFNESGAIAKVLEEIPAHLVDEVIVVDNGSTDGTARAAAALGATVLREPAKGYGAACLLGMAHIRAKAAARRPDIVVFLDGDHSDYPEEMDNLVAPVADGSSDLVIGSRALGDRERGSMTPQQLFGNWLATRLVHRFYGVRFTDLGPFRAISWEKLEMLGMADRNYGWTVEMQIKAAKMGLRCSEVPVRYRRRIGQSKVSGTLKGTIMAGYKIIRTIIKYR